jgi:hypothetical protein
MLRARIFLFCCLSALTFGCGSGISQRPVQSDAALGRVIVYRSGVAYFERHALVRDGKLTLNVPAERVDDFLKSLTIRDTKTGRSLPVSFPTVAREGDRVARVWIRHFVPEGWKLREGKVKPEKLRGAYLFPVNVPARASLTLTIEETTPLEKTVDINTAAGVETLALFLQKSKPVDPALGKQLDEIIALHKGMVDTEEHVRTLESQMATYRERVDEIHIQLVTLRRVNQADKLSRHLAQKMDEISDRLQKATIEVTDLKGQLMTSRVALADKLAELTLKTAKDEKAVANNAE